MDDERSSLELSSMDIALPGLAGDRALVTGGSRGIGRATALLLARCGASVGIAYRSALPAAEETLRGIETLHARFRVDATNEVGDLTSWAEAGDLSREQDVANLFKRVDDEFGGLDVFVGNAGVWNEEPIPVDQLQLEVWRAMLGDNLTSLYLSTREAAARMTAGARIILLSSTAGQRGEPGHSHYAASKGAIISFCKSLAGELGPRGITVNCVAPGWVDTDLSAAVLRSGRVDEVLAEIPLRRVAQPEDVAGPVCFLASSLARHMTGAVLNVNGGSVL
jgi:3-oxoacyl-[acyl-carrier protein] reductase